MRRFVIATVAVPGSWRSPRTRPAPCPYARLSWPATW